MYIKIFENFGYYTTISLDEYYRLGLESSCIDMSKNLFLQIKKLFPIDKYEFHQKYCYGKFQGIEYVIDGELVRDEIEISLLEDEYFIIKKFRNLGGGKIDNIQFFKCDGFDGLEYCLYNEEMI